MKKEDITLELVKELYDIHFTNKEHASTAGWKLATLGLLTTEMSFELKKIENIFESKCLEIANVVIDLLPQSIKDLYGNKINPSYFPISSDIRDKNQIKIVLGNHYHPIHLNLHLHTGKFSLYTNHFGTDFPENLKQEILKLVA